MAIKDFGESILADVRKRKDDQRKRDEGGTLGKIQRGLETVQDVAEIGQSFGLFGGTAEDKYNAFKTNKAVMDTNINIGRAQTNADYYDTVKKAIKSSTSSTEEYFLDQTVKETIDASLKLSKNAKYALDTDAEDKYRITYGAELRELDKVKEAAKFATDQYTKFGVVRDRFSQTGTIKEAMELAKSKIPNALRSMGSIFTGEDLNQAAVDSYTTGLRAQGATQVQVFEQILEATGGDFTQAVDLAEEAGISKEALKSATTTITKHIDTGGGEIVTVQYEKDIFGVETIVQGSAKQTDLRTEERRVAVKKANFNPQNVIVSQLNTQGNKEAMEMGFVRGQVVTEAVYKKNVEILNTLLSNTLYSKPIVSENEKNRNKLKGTLVGALYSDPEFLRAQTDVTNQSGFMAAEREKIVAQNPKLGDKEIETLLLKNENYKRAYKSFTASNSMVINKNKSINDVVDATFPLPTNPDDAETADIKAGSTPKPTSLIKTTGKSLGVDNKNLLNVRPNVDENDPWLGQSGVDQNYAVFESIDMGIRAGDRVLTTYGTKHGINTIEKVLNRFAPKGDGNDTESYIKNVSEKTGIARDEKIDLSDSSVRDALLSAMVRQETGENVSGDQIRAAVIRANETEEGSSSTVTQEQVDAAVKGETTVNKISDADALAWAKKNNYEGISVAQIRREHTAEVIADRDNPTIQQKVAEVIANVSAYQKEVGVKNDLHRAKFKEMSDKERYYFNQTLNYPDRIVEMFKDGIPTPPITKSNRSSSLLVPVNKKLSNYGVN